MQSLNQCLWLPWKLQVPDFAGAVKSFKRVFFLQRSLKINDDYLYEYGAVTFCESRLYNGLLHPSMKYTNYESVYSIKYIITVT